MKELAIRKLILDRGKLKVSMSSNIDGRMFGMILPFEEYVERMEEYNKIESDYNGRR